jgi:hypothetical protein
MEMLMTRLAEGNEDFIAVAAGVAAQFHVVDLKVLLAAAVLAAPVIAL